MSEYAWGSLHIVPTKQVVWLPYNMILMICSLFVLLVLILLAAAIFNTFTFLFLSWDQNLKSLHLQIKPYYNKIEKYKDQIIIKESIIYHLVNNLTLKAMQQKMSGFLIQNQKKRFKNKIQIVSNSSHIKHFSKTARA